MRMKMKFSENFDPKEEGGGVGFMYVTKEVIGGAFCPTNIGVSINGSWYPGLAVQGKMGFLKFQEFMSSKISFQAITGEVHLISNPRFRPNIWKK